MVKVIIVNLKEQIFMFLDFHSKEKSKSLIESTQQFTKDQVRFFKRFIKHATSQI